MVRLVRHRQTKGPATDRPHLNHRATSRLHKRLSRRSGPKYPLPTETPVKVLDPEVPGKAAQGYLWFFAVPRGDVILEFSRSRGQQVPRQRLAGFQGTIQTDAYEVYQAIERKDAALRRIGCLAHARRRFYQALRDLVTEAIWFIGQIRLLYRLEEQIRLLDPAERYRIRQDLASFIRPISAPPKKSPNSSSKSPPRFPSPPPCETSVFPAPCGWQPNSPACGCCSNPCGLLRVPDPVRLTISCSQPFTASVLPVRRPKYHPRFRVGFSCRAFYLASLLGRFRTDFAGDE